jgi:hypothetical protein
LLECGEIVEHADADDRRTGAGRSSRIGMQRPDAKCIATGPLIPARVRIAT